MTVRNRIQELRHVRAGELQADPRNWRRHPSEQRRALQTVLDDIGYADAVIARETPDGLVLIDGHLRADLDVDQMVPVLVTDLDETEAGQMLATLDPLAAMALSDEAALESLLADLQASASADLAALLEEVNADNLPLPDRMAEWDDMPEFDNEGNPSYRRVMVHFRDAAAVVDFVDKLGIELSDAARYLHYPAKARRKVAHLRYQQEGEPVGAAETAAE